MSNTHNHLIGALPIVAQALGDKLGVRVEIGGSRAATDGSTIWLPALPPDSEAAAVLARGFIDHEAGHIRFTEGTMEGSPLERALQNLLEDVRIERAMGARYPGSRQNLKRLAERLVADGKLGPVSETAPPAAVACSYLLYRLRSALLGQDALAPLAEQAGQVFHRTFPEGVATRIAAIAFEVERARSTEDVRALARRIIRSLEEAADEQPPEPDTPPSSDGEAEAASGADQSEEGSPEGSRSGADPDDAGGVDGEPAPNGTPAEGESGDGESAPGAPGKDAGAGDALTSGSDRDGQDAGSNAAAQDPPATGAGAATTARQTLSATDAELAGQDLGEILAGSLDAISGKTSSAEAVCVAGDRPAGLVRRAGNLDADRARRATVALRARLEGLLQSSRLERNRPTRSGGRIDPRKLHRTAVGDSRVFAASRSRVAVNTAVTVLLDRSSSMSTNLQQTANEAVYAAALALSAIPGVALHTAAFPVQGCDIATITPFGGRVIAEAYSVWSGGRTPLAEALWRIAMMLCARPEPRRICVVATDGDPDREAPVHDIVRRMESAGIEILALGIETAAPAKFFANTQVIDSVADLPTALLGMLQRTLLSAA